MWVIDVFVATSGAKAERSPVRPERGGEMHRPRGALLLAALVMAWTTRRSDSVPDQEAVFSAKIIENGTCTELGYELATTESECKQLASLIGRPYGFEEED